MTPIALERAVELGAGRCGAKACRLGQVRGMGLSCLPGCVLLADELAQAIVVPEQLLDLLQAPAPRDGAGRRAQRLLLTQLRSQISWKYEISELCDAILERLGRPPQGVIARSSAGGEDGSQYSWAGIFSSVFAPLSSAGLSQALLEVWSSSFSEAAVAYQRRIGARGGPEPLSILIQPAISPRVSGVAFSHHPVAGGGKRLVEATWGLPEGVVDASIAVDRFSFGPGVTSLVEEIADKPRALELCGGQVVDRSMPVQQVPIPCLTVAELRTLDNLLQALEQEFQGPQDVEWAMTTPGDPAIVLQTRPQTATRAIQHSL